MNKLKLDVDSLRIESFETSRGARAAMGTVRANQVSAVTGCGCVSTVFSMACRDDNGDTVWDSYDNPGGESQMHCTELK